MQAFIRQIDLRRKPVVPHGHDGVDGHHRQNGLCQGQIDAAQNCKIAGAVYERRFPYIPGQPREIGAGENDVPDIEGRRHNDGENIVVEIELAHEQKGGDQSAAKVHGQQHKGNHIFSAPQFRNRQRIGTHHARDDHQHRGGHCIQDGISVGTPHIGIGKDFFIGLQFKSRGPKGYVHRQHILGLADGHDENIVHGIQGEQADDCHRDHDQHIHQPRSIWNAVFLARQYLSHNFFSFPSAADHHSE